MEEVDCAHGKEHVYRVLANALDIMEHIDDKCDIDILIVSSLLHDIGRVDQKKKLDVCHAEIGSKKAYEYLLAAGWEESRAQLVSNAILTHRQKKKRQANSTEARILYDADKLDSLGLIGIARMLMYGGMIDEPLYVLDKDGNIVTESTLNEKSSFFQEFSLKLGVIESLYTEYAKDLARKRLNDAVVVCNKLKIEINQCRRDSYIRQFCSVEEKKLVNILFPVYGILPVLWKERRHYLDGSLHESKYFNSDY